MRIVSPEFDNPIIKEAVEFISETDPDFVAVPANSLVEACEIVKNQNADAIIAGIDLTTREMVLTCKEHLGMVNKTFSSSFIMKKDNADTLIVADAGVAKNPAIGQLVDIVLQTYGTASKVLNDEPRIAMLSFSTFGRFFWTFISPL